MKIKNVEFIPLRFELPEPLKLSIGEIRYRPFGIVRIETDEEIIGYGECFVNFPPWTIYEKKFTIEMGIKNLVINENPLNIEKLWWKMYNALYRFGIIWGKGAIMQAIAAMDIALWDIKGKYMNASIFELLGGALREKIPLYATGISMKDPAKDAKDKVKQGYKMLKLRVGFGREKDIGIVRSVREAVGDDIKIMVDANMAWSRDEALKMIRELEKFDLLWVEEPVRADDIKSYKWLSRRIKTPIAAGENAYDIIDFKQLIFSGAVKYVMPDVSKAGGITLMRKIISLIEMQGLYCTPHYYGSDLGFAATLHLIAWGKPCIFTQRDVTKAPLREEILKKRIEIRNGEVEVPKDPGLGVEINEKIIEKYRIDVKY